MDRSPRSLVSIDLGAVRHNVAFMRSRTAAGTRFMAAVKADAYGHGAVPVARAVLDAGGYGLAVATAEEAVELRDAGITAPVLVMGPLYGLDQLVEMARRDVEVAVVSPDVGEMLAHLPSVGTPLRVHVKIDTGMNRQGLYPGREFETFLDTVRVARNVKVVGVMTHFANAAAEPNLVAQQLQRFFACVERVHATYPQALVHAANSAATVRYPESHFDMVRCGIGIYGMSPFQADARAEGLRPVLSWTSMVVMTKRVRPGEGVGYGLTFRPTNERVVALIPVGYADGVFRALGNRGEVVIRGRRRPMVGRVSMDSFAVDLGNNEDGVVPGDVVTLIGSEGSVCTTAEEVSAWVGTINYEITCAIRLRWAVRVFTNEIVSEAGEEAVGEPVPVEAMIEEAE